MPNVGADAEFIESMRRSTLQRTDEKLWVTPESPGVHPGNVRALIAAYDRLKADSTEKDAQIKALADALLDKGDTYEDGWHMFGCPAADVSEGPCSERCQRDRAALKAAGRL